MPIVLSSSTALSTSRSVATASARCERPALLTRMSICGGREGGVGKRRRGGCT